MMNLQLRSSVKATTQLQNRMRIRNFPSSSSTQHFRSSSSSSASANFNNAEAAAELASTASTASGTIQRHGPGDGIVALNVGGTHFQTLRSTVAQNEVLMDHVVRAEAAAAMANNAEVFVDRDPRHFGTILTYLRNRADGVHKRGVSRRLLKFGDKICSGNETAKEVSSLAAKSVPAATSTSMPYIQLPKDTNALTELYHESLHYDIPELAQLIYSQKSLARVFGAFGSTNPLKATSAAFAAGRNALIAVGGMLTGMGGWAYAQYAQARDAVVDTKEFLRDRRDDLAGVATSVDGWRGPAEEAWEKISGRGDGGEPSGGG